MEKTSIPSSQESEEPEVYRDVLLEKGVELDIESGNADTYIVSWDGERDPENPLNWSPTKRWSMVGLVSLLTFIPPFASTMCAPSVPLIMAEMGSTDSVLGAFIVSIFVLGLATGPLFLSPMSEVYGRLPLYHICNVLFFAFTIGSALCTNVGMVIAFRFLGGCASAAPMSIGGGTIADIIKHKRRGLAMTLFSAGPILGSTIGPVGGGYLVQNLGWRWGFWTLSIIIGVITVLLMITLRETYGPVLLSRKAARLSAAYSPDFHFHTRHTRNTSPTRLLKTSLARPIWMLINPIVIILSILMATTYGYLYLLYTTFSMVFVQQYEFSTGAIGLSYLGIGVGAIIAAGIYSRGSDKIARHLSAKHKGIQPEWRIPLMFPSAFLVPAGLLWYGWSAQYKAHWIMPILGTGLFAIGQVLLFMSVQSYLVDAFEIYAASALAANMILRSIGGTFLPLAGEPMFHKLGFGWGNTLLAGIALLMAPWPFLLFKYGKQIRERTPVKI